MKAVVTRVKNASVTLNGETRAIDGGFLVLLGIKRGDTQKEVDYMVDRIVKMRVFSDENGKMNLSLLDVAGQLLIISNFTLYADASQRRPSFINSAPPDEAKKLYDSFVELSGKHVDVVKTGEFGADMLVASENDGPVTVVLDTAELMK